ncbi:MAG: glycosyltransferase family 2 protein [Bacilli bacterium]|nr:glycosyltransferase family 2 protein [Bacilli bacterium]
MEKELTVVIPAYNAHETLYQTLASLVMQTKKDNLHCIIVDDHSEKTYNDIIEQFQNLLSIELIRMEYNQGPSYARNVGLDKTQTPYIMFIDADDNLIHPYVIEKLLQPLLDDPMGYMIVSNFIEQGEENSFVNIREEDYIWVFGKIYNVNYLRKHNIRFGQYNQNEDTAFNMECRMAATKQDIIYHLNDLTYEWNYRPNAITKINNAEYSFTTCEIGAIGNITEVLKKFKATPNDPEFYYSNLLTYLLGAYYSYNKMIFLKNGYDKELLRVAKIYYKTLIDNDDIIFNNPYVNFYEVYSGLSSQHYRIPAPWNYISITFDDFLSLLKK